MRKAGVGLVILSYALVLYMSLAAPAYAHVHPHLDPAMLGAYAGPWPVSLACTLALAGIVLALIPLRTGQRWGFWTLVAMLAIPFLTRITTDPRCLLVLDPHQHGCHTFMACDFNWGSRSGARPALNC